MREAVGGQQPRLRLQRDYSQTGLHTARDSEKTYRVLCVSVLCERTLYSMAVLGDLDGARADFETAARSGSRFAEKEAATLHPMAQMCNSAVTQMLSKLEKV